MPRSFPDMQSLINNAKMRNFRMPEEGETEAEYRKAQAHFLRTEVKDIVEAGEVETGLGWDVMQIDPAFALRNMLGEEAFAELNSELLNVENNAPENN